jgi:hypothetical protein
VGVRELEQEHLDTPSGEGARRERRPDGSEECELVFAPSAAVNGLPKTLRSSKDQAAFKAEVEGRLDSRPLRSVSLRLEFEDRAVADAMTDLLQEKARATA